MKHPSNLELEAVLAEIISDGFNRSLNALAQAGAIDTTKLAEQYKGAGSKYYDLVTAQIALTAQHGAKSIKILYSEAGDPK